MRIWIDADACPRAVKERVFKASRRLGIPTVLVANRELALPRSALVSAVVVGKDVDAADRHIAVHCDADDLVITADIPLARELVGKGVAALSPRGTVYTPDNVHEALATRDLLEELRAAGIMEGGPAPLGQGDDVRFANALDRELTRLQRRQPPKA